MISSPNTKIPDVSRTERPVSAAAFCKARHKISFELLRNLVHQICESFESKFPEESRWHGRRLFAVDGSKLNLRRSEELEDAFGVPHSGHCPQVLVSTLFNVVSKIPYDITIRPYASCERAELCNLSENLESGDVIILDRGYPSYDLVCLLEEWGVDFLIRVPAETSFGSVRDFAQSDATDQVIAIHPSWNAALRESGAIGVRAVKIEGRDATQNIFITSIPKIEVSRAGLGKLYRMRWEVEEFYKLIKSDDLGQKQFHSLTPQGVRQEILALTLFVALTRYLMATASAVQNDPPDDSLSPKTAVLGVAAYLTRLLLGREEVVLLALASLARRLVRVKDPPRPGRSFPRRSFKPRRRWGPLGHQRG